MLVFAYYLHTYVLYLELSLPFGGIFSGFNSKFIYQVFKCNDIKDIDNRFKKK